MTDSIWNKILTDDELIDQVKVLCNHANPVVALNACKWVAEGKGYKTGLNDMDINEIEFKGLAQDKSEIPF